MLLIVLQIRNAWKVKKLLSVNLKIIHSCTSKRLGVLSKKELALLYIIMISVIAIVFVIVIALPLPLPHAISIIIVIITIIINIIHIIIWLSVSSLLLLVVVSQSPYSSPSPSTSSKTIVIILKYKLWNAQNTPVTKMHMHLSARAGQCFINYDILILLWWLAYRS